MTMTGIDMKHVPYRGGGQAINDVVAGHVPVYFADVGPAAALIKAGNLRALGVTTATRTANLPDVPTLNEAGVTGYEANTWQMMVGPARMPERSLPSSTARSPISCARRRRNSTSFRSACSRQRHAAEAQDYINGEAARWTQIIKGIGVSMD